MRLVFLILLLINLLAYLWGAGYLGLRDGGREPERLAAQVQPEAIRVLAPTAPRACQQIDNIDAAHLAQLRKQLEALTDIELSVSDLPAPGTAAPVVLVAIPSLESADQAQRKLGELHSLKIADASVVEDAHTGPFMVVIGTFHDNASAQKRLDELTARGVRSARLVTREAAEPKSRVILHWPASVAAQRQSALQAWLSGIPASDGLRMDACASK